ncbi:MAG: glycosyltransferase family 39 protein [Pseudomonadota bacterium]
MVRGRGPRAWDAGRLAEPGRAEPLDDAQGGTQGGAHDAARAPLVAPPKRSAPAEAYRADAPPPPPSAVGAPLAPGAGDAAQLPAGVEPPGSARAPEGDIPLGGRRGVGGSGGAPAAPSGALPPPPASAMTLLLALGLGLYLTLAFGHAALAALAEPSALTAAAAVAVIALAAAAAQIRWSFGVAAVLAASAAGQLVWALWLAPNPIGESSDLWLEATRFGASLAAAAPDWRTLHESATPAAVLLYAPVTALFGEDIVAARIFSTCLWLAQTWLVWRIAQEVSELKPAAFAAALLFGLSPALLSYGGQPSVEAVFGLFALSAIYVILSHRQRGLAQSAAQSGALAALAFLTRPVAFAFFLGLALILMIGFARAEGIRYKARMLGALAAACVGFLVGVAPQAILNLHRGDVLSIAPGPAIGYQLMVGTNRDDVRGFSPEDMRRAGFVGPDRPPLREQDQAARRIAWEQVSADPAGFAVFALTEKMRRLWGAHEEVLYASVAPATGAAERFAASPLAAWGPPAMIGAHLALLFAAALGVWRLAARRGAVRDPTRWVLFAVSFLALGASHLLFEVRAPNQLAFLPLLAMLAPLPFIRLPKTAARVAREEARAAAQAAAEAAAARAAELEKQTAAADAAAAAMPGPAAEVAGKSAEERLAYALKRMSKPPRPKDDPET